MSDSKLKPSWPSPYMTMDEAAEYLRYAGARAGDKTRQFLQRSGVRMFKRGNAYLVRRSSIDLLIETGIGDIEREARARLRRTGTSG